MFDVAKLVEFNAPFGAPHDSDQPEYFLYGVRSNAANFSDVFR